VRQRYTAVYTAVHSGILGFRVWGLGLRVKGAGFKISGLGLRVKALGTGFRVEGPNPSETAVYHSCRVRSTVERIWHIQDSHGQILALARDILSTRVFEIILVVPCPLLSRRKCSQSRFAKFNARINLSTHPSSLLKRISRRICAGIDFCKTTS
jgi:hypothetical protein